MVSLVVVVVVVFVVVVVVVVVVFVVVVVIVVGNTQSTMHIIFPFDLNHFAHYQIFCLKVMLLTTNSSMC